jgi:predicted PurR-regulated permease PerM
MTEQSLDLSSATPAEGDVPQWESTSRYIAAAFLVVALALSLVALVPVVDTVAFGLVFAFLFYAPIRGISRRLSGHYILIAILFYVVLLAIVALAFVLGFRYLSASAAGLSFDIEDAVARLEQTRSEAEGLVNQGAVKLAEVVIDVLLSAFGNLISLIALVTISLFFSFLLLINLDGGQGSLAKLVPERYYEEVALVLTRFDRIWVGYLTAQVIYGSLLAVFSYVEYLLLGVPYPLLMAAITGFVSLIPSIGGLLASIIVAVPCLLLGSTVFVDMPNGMFALIVLLINVVITQLTYNFVALPIVGKYVSLPTSLVLIGVLFGGALGSILLAFLIVPILSTLVTLAGYVLAKVQKRDPFPDRELADPPEVGFFSQLLIRIQT